MDDNIREEIRQLNLELKKAHREVKRLHRGRIAIDDRAPEKFGVGFTLGPNGQIVIQIGVHGEAEFPGPGVVEIDVPFHKLVGVLVGFRKQFFRCDPLNLQGSGAIADETIAFGPAKGRAFADAKSVSGATLPHKAGQDLSTPRAARCCNIGGGVHVDLHNGEIGHLRLPHWLSAE